MWCSIAGEALDSRVSKIEQIVEFPMNTIDQLVVYN